MSQTPLSSYSGAPELVWSETGPVTQPEPLDCTLIQSAVYILQGSDAVLLLSQEETRGLADPSGGVQESQDLWKGSL